VSVSVLLAAKDVNVAGKDNQKKSEIGMMKVRGRGILGEEEF